MSFLEIVKQEAETLANKEGLILYDVEWVNENRMQILRISLNIPDRPIDVDSCAAFSDKIAAILDEKDLIPQAYYLEVCSPGAERELRSVDEIKAAVNDYVYCKLKDPKEGLSDVTGDLLEADDSSVLISYRDKTRVKQIRIAYDNLALIRLAIKF